jgi:hypothetical protein
MIYNIIATRMPSIIVPKQLYNPLEMPTIQKGGKEKERNLKKQAPGTGREGVKIMAG